MSSAIVITGTLRADSQHRRTSDLGSVLSFELELPACGGPKPVVVRGVQPYGTGEAAAHVASARARRLRRGVRVAAHAQGLRSSRGALVLHNVTQIDEPDLVLRNVTGERDA